MMQVIDAQPLTVWPIKWVTIDQITPMKLNRATITPKVVISLIGFIESEVIPSKARLSILDNG